MKKYFKLFVTFLVLMLLTTSCLAATPVAKGDATMKLVEDNVNSMSFGEYGEFEKKMVQIDTTNKTIDIQLTARNTQEEAEPLDGEVVLLIDASRSMSTNQVSINNETLSRKELVLKAADQLIDKLLTANDQIKIGVVEFATSTSPETEGTSADAKIITEALTNDSTTLKDALDTIKTDVMGARTDIEIGLETAESLLNTSDNETANKYVVILSDAVPNTSKGVVEDLYTEQSADPTKDKLLDLESKGIEVISMLINISDNNIPVSGRPEDATFQTYKQVAEYIFGTPMNPTVGSVYYVSDSQVVDTVTNTIYSKLTPENMYNELTDIIIKDYFPQNIIDNFDFAILTEANIGEIEAEVNTSDNSITWTISELKPGEEATFTYRLTLKNTFSSEIVGKNLPTNKDVTIDYTENGKEGPQKHNDKAPVVILDVPSPKKIPQTGSNTNIAGYLVSLSVLIATISFILLKRNKLN